jgi:hypothetical protein
MELPLIIRLQLLLYFNIHELSILKRISKFWKNEVTRFLEKPGRGPSHTLHVPIKSANGVFKFSGPIKYCVNHEREHSRIECVVRQMRVHRPYRPLLKRLGSIKHIAVKWYHDKVDYGRYRRLTKLCNVSNLHSAHFQIWNEIERTAFMPLDICKHFEFYHNCPKSAAVRNCVISGPPSIYGIFEDLKLSIDYPLNHKYDSWWSYVFFKCQYTDEELHDLNPDLLALFNK